MNLWQSILSLLLLLLLLGMVWYLRRDRSAGSPTPFLNGKREWPDSLLRFLPEEEQLAQLLIYKPNIDLPEQEKLLYGLRSGHMPGGVWLDGLNLLNYLFLMDSLQRTAPLPMLLFANDPVLHNNLFADVDPAPAPSTLSAVPGNAHHGPLNRLFVEQSKILGLNLVAPFTMNAPWRDSSSQLELLTSLNKARILTGAQGLNDLNPTLPDTLPEMAAMLGALRQLRDQGLGFLLFDQRLPGTDSLRQWPDDFLARYLKEFLDYDGLIVGIVSEETPLEYWIRAGADLFITEEVPETAVARMLTLQKSGDWKRSSVRKSLRKVFLAKQWMYGSRNSRAPASQYRQLQTRIQSAENSKTSVGELDVIWKHFRETNWAHLNYELREKALILSNTSRQLLPWNNMDKTRFFIWEPGGQAFPEFERLFAKYAPFQKIADAPAAGILRQLGDSSRCALVVLLSAQTGNPVRDTILQQTLRQLNSACPMVLINFGIPQLHRALDSNFTMIHLFELHPHTEALAAQLFFGGVAAKGQWPFFDTLGPPVHTTQAVRLGFSSPESAGIAPEKLVGIDAIARTAIDRQFMPGCQIVVARNNRIVYSKAFGHPTYSSETPVQTEHVYDVASLTKIASTTMAVMYLYEQGVLDLNDRLDQHLPWLKGKAAGRISIRNLLTHQSGLPSGLPVNAYIKARKYSRRACDLFFCNRQRPGYTVPVARDLYFNQRYLREIRDKVANIQPGKRRNYRYSDLNFWLLQQVVEARSGQSLDVLSARIFYEPLGMRHTVFNAARHFEMEQIIPTQQDKIWRRQLLQGYVHDPAAAILGGVSGHAGLFSNAEDMAILMQLLLNQGSYGGRQWFNPETVERFTQSTYGNHRSLGFDHPSAENKSARARNAPAQLFGHTGFTGGCAWADPTNNLVYIFLSNRVYPDGNNRDFIRENIRARIHQVIYDALGSYEAEFPQI